MLETFSSQNHLILQK